MKAWMIIVLLYQVVLSYGDVCPDRSTCPGTQTCCPYGTGFGCCPYSLGVCCADRQHCCPFLSICVPGLNICVLASKKGNETIYQSTIKSKPIYTNKVSNKSCHGSVCQDDETCCASGCCPLPNAVCCSNGKYCCPEGTVCDNERNLCLAERNNEVISTSTSVRNNSVTTAFAKNTPCGQSFCFDYETCCNDDSCCPLPNAVCCSDGRHCCPAGTTCDVQKQQCIKQTGEITSSLIQTENRHKNKTQTTSKKVNYIYCPGGAYICPDSTTCCPLRNGTWGCCPFVSAFCCADKVHCCPRGSHCDSTYSSCIQGSYYIPWQKKYEAIPVGKL